ncbi:MAG: type II secretion system protein N [Alphaproteobacteria bacterium]|nr:type II secretion system protein N [Alphaproteobacteria bacterium]
MSWPQRLVTLLLAGLAVGSVVFWGLQISAMPSAEEVRWVEQTKGDAPQAWQRALGGTQAQATAPAPVAGSPLTLVAVLARGSQGGMAVIASSGQRGESYRVGDEVQPALVLLEVGLRSVRLGPAVGGPATQVLELAVPVMPVAPDAK